MTNEITIEQRVNWAESALQKHISVREGYLYPEPISPEDVQDLISDLLHYYMGTFDRSLLSLIDMINVARNNFEAERDEAKEWLND